MTNKPDPSLFSVNLQEGQYEAIFEVTGKLYHRITADSQKSACDQADAMMEEDSGELDLFDLDGAEVELYSVRKCPPMYRITRDGQAMQVSYLQAGDLPREPDARGF